MVNLVGTYPKPIDYEKARKQQPKNKKRYGDLL